MTKKEKTEKTPMTTKGKISLVFAIIFLVAMTVFFISIGWIVPYIIFMAFCAVVAFFNKMKEKKEKMCSKCKVQYDFDTDIEYEEIRSFTKVTNKSAQGAKDVYGVERHEIQFECTCPQCNEVKRYKKKMDGAKLYGDGHVEYINLEKQIETYYNNGEDVSVGAIAFLALLSVIFIVLSLFSTGIIKADLGFLSDDGAIGGITESIEDPADYYGTYYYIENSQLNTVEFTSSSCVITNMNGRTVESETYPYDYVSAEYASTRLASPEYSEYDAILAYVNSDKSQCIVFWVKSNNNGNYTFITASGAIASKDVLTFADVTNDPADYYGTYNYGDLYVTLENDGTAKMDLGEGEGMYSYMYADGNHLKTWYNSNYNSAIVVFEDNSDGAYIFNYVNNELILQDTYTFSK